jgi:hypothetical protein
MLHEPNPIRGRKKVTGRAGSFVMQIRNSECVRTRLSTDQALCGGRTFGEDWKFPSCKSEKRSSTSQLGCVALRKLFALQWNFAAEPMFNSRRKHLYSADHCIFASKTEVQSRSLAKNRASQSLPRPRNRKYDLRRSLPFSPRPSNIELVQCS